MRVVAFLHERDGFAREASAASSMSSPAILRAAANFNLTRAGLMLRCLYPQDLLHVSVCFQATGCVQRGFSFCGKLTVQVRLAKPCKNSLVRLGVESIASG